MNVVVFRSETLAMEFDAKVTCWKCHIDWVGYHSNMCGCQMDLIGGHSNMLRDHVNGAGAI